MEHFEEICVEAFQCICRTCLKYSCLYPLDEVQMEEGKLNSVLLLFESLQFDHKNIEMPQNMCRSCIVKFYDMYRFMRNCVVVQEFLKRKLLESVGKKNNQPSSTENRMTDGVDEPTTAGKEINSETQNNDDKTKDTTWSCDENNCDSDSDLSTTDSIVLNGTDEKLVVAELVDQIQQIKTEITTIKTSVPPRKLISRTKRRVPADSSSRASTVKRIRIEGPPFVCSECSESFDIYMLLRKHWQMYNHHPKNFKCIYCPVAFRGNSILQQHIRTHTGEKPNVCNICNRRFNHRSNFRRHMYTHSELKRYRCNECGHGFNRLEFLKDHQRKYHSGEKLLCPYCGKEFTCQSTLKIHEKQHINYKAAVVIDSNIPYQCKTCGKILASEEILNEHAQVHVKKKAMKKVKKIGDAKYKERKDPVCEHCQSAFKNSYELRLHRLDSPCSQFIPRYNCPQCDKIFITYGALYAHLKLHKEASENNIYECNVCQEQFYKERRYKDHVKRHTRERKFVCIYCSQGFFIKLHLENHLRTHTGERPFVCEICHKAFALKVNLTVHMRIHNNIKPYKCCICNHEFRDISSLRKHSKRYHNVDVTLDIK